MAAIAVSRAQHFIGFIGYMRAVGVPVDRELARAKLPVFLEDLPDAYVSLDLVFKFLTRCVEQQRIDDLGFLVGWDLRLEDLGADMLQALKCSPTVLARLNTFSRICRLEASILRCTYRTEGDQTRVCIAEDLPAGVDRRLSEWQSLMALIQIVRSGLGRNWMPGEIAPRSSRPVHQSVQERLGDVRVRVNQQVASFLVPTILLGRPIRRNRPAVPDCPGSANLVNSEAAVDLEDPIETLRATLHPYLSSGYPSIGLAAEIAGLSTRGFQRLLADYQTSYSELIGNLRYELATEMLADPDMKVTDVALQLGYEHTPNFSRAFRRMSGQTPLQYRRGLVLT
jgi:AraC-like DNA-binding protein